MKVFKYLFIGSFFFLASIDPIQASVPKTVSNTVINLPPTRQVTTVSSLPTCNEAIKGQMYLVTNALLPTILMTVVGGGTVIVGVTCNGTNWIVQ